MNADVLVVTNTQDLAADLVIVELGRRGVPALRCNTEDLTSWSVELVPGQRWRLVDDLGRSADSRRVNGVWWRRPERPSNGRRLRTPAQAQAFDEQWLALAEGLSGVPGPRWVSPPAALRAAEDKAHQLAVAARVGLRTPKTLWTNALDAARTFLDEVGGVGVLKTVAAAHWEDEDEAGFVFARRLPVAELPDPASFADLPAALQQRIEPKRDLRVTVVGDQVMAAAIATDPHGDSLDWRLEPDRAWSAYSLPDAESRACAELVAELGLGFGAIDMARDRTGRHWFLEVNPNGEWAWLEKAAGLPIASALASTLIRPQ